MLFYIIYQSIEAYKMSISEIEGLAHKASKKNFKLGITGLLLRKNESFIQYLEGDRTTIIMLYDEILSDKRHQSLRLLDKGNIQERKFDKWSMLLKNVTQQEIHEIEIFKNMSPKSKKKNNWGNYNNLDVILELINNYQNHN